MLSNGDIPCTASGWTPTPPVQTDLNKTPDDNYEYDNPEIRQIRDGHMKYVKGIAEICREHDLRLVLLSVPITPQFRNHRRHRGLAEMAICVDEVRQVYPQAEYYDFSNDTCYNNSYFYDHRHLNPEGAKKFSKELAPILLR